MILAGRDYNCPAQHSPIVDRQREIRRGEHGESDAGRIVGEGELERAASGLHRPGQSRRIATEDLRLECADIAAVAARLVGNVGEVHRPREAALVGIANQVRDGVGLTTGPFPSKITAFKHRMVPRHAIKKFTAEVGQRFKPARIILFGSYAYGKPTPDSDVDLLVVMPCKGRSLDAALKVRLAVDAGFPLDLIVRTPRELRRRLALGDFFLREIVNKGEVLYEGAHP